MNKNMLAMAVVVASSFAAPTAFAQEDDTETWLTGIASVIDGDSIMIEGKDIRLYGIDAPEPDQVCFSNGMAYSCGDQATMYLSDMIYGQTVKCRIEDEDAYGRLHANCLWGKRNINEVMVLTGNAVAWRRQSDFYVDTERRAKTSKNGIWATDFAMPEDWRDAKARQLRKQQERSNH